MGSVRATALLAGMLVALGACSGKTSSSEDSAKRKDRDEESASPDSILQARLQQAVRDVDKREARRGPDALFLRTGHALGMAGELGSATPPTEDAPKVKLGDSSVAGRLPPEVVQRIVRGSFGKLRACYDTALRANPNLTGRVKVAFTIGRDGSVGDVKETTEIEDKAFAACIRAGFSAMSFPKPDGGVVRVTYPLQFAPGDVPSPSSSANANAPLTPDDPPSAEPEQPPRKPVDARGPWPIVTVDKSVIRLDGESMGSSKAMVESGKLQKIDELFTAMKRRREAWKDAHPDMAFPGVVGLRVDADVPTVAFKSVFQTLAYTGYPYVFVQSASDPEHIVEVAAQIPGPPDFETRPQAPVLDLHLFVTATEVSLTWRQGEVMPEPERKAPLDAALPDLVCNSWKQKGSHRDPGDERQDRFVLHADNTVPFEQIERVTRGVLACTRAREGAPAPIPVFWFQLAMR